jgi:hypothetical protein
MSCRTKRLPQLQVPLSENGRDVEDADRVLVVMAGEGGAMVQPLGSVYARDWQPDSQEKMGQ